MKITELEKKLIKAAKTEVLSDKVPYAFEKRVTALLQSRKVAQSVDFWVSGLWRAAISCVAVALLCGAWTLLTPSAQANSEDLSLSLDTTLLASVDQTDQAQ